MNHRIKQVVEVGVVACILSLQPAGAKVADDADLLLLKNERVAVGIDRTKGGSITWLSWTEYPDNMVNIHDPGRLIQQSYYAGKRRDRTAEGQGAYWNPWSWNPIQGGGLSSWARVNVFERQKDGSLYVETVPKLWDMPDEEAAALMRQWTGFEPEMSNVVMVRCELVCQRDENDAWGKAGVNPQEIPACYFTRNFETVKTYLGDGKWRKEHQKPGPPWGRATPPLRAMAFFDASGQGVAVYSPVSVGHWNFGPHLRAMSDDPVAGPCMHVAPVVRVPLRPKSTFRYRYWLIVGDQSELTQALDSLINKYSDETYELTNP